MLYNFSGAIMDSSPVSSTPMDNGKYHVTPDSQEDITMKKPQYLLESELLHSDKSLISENSGKIDSLVTEHSKQNITQEGYLGDIETNKYEYTPHPISSRTRSKENAIKANKLMEDIMNHINMSLTVDSAIHKVDDRLESTSLLDNSEDEGELEGTLPLLSEDKTIMLNNISPEFYSRALSCTSPTKGLKTTLTEDLKTKIQNLNNTENAIRAVDDYWDQVDELSKYKMATHTLQEKIERKIMI